MKRLCLLLLLPAFALAIYDREWFDLNHWRCPFNNEGRWGFDITRPPGSAGGSWPQPLRNFYIFGAGPWVGAVVGSDTLVTVGYDPNTAETEFGPTLCRYWRQGTGDSLDRIYQHPGDWPPPRSRFPMAPQSSRSEMDLWCCLGDSDGTNHIQPGRPLGIDVCLTVFGFSDFIARDVFILKYELTNASATTLSRAYFGLVLDGDVGECADDMAGLILSKLFPVGPDTFRVSNVGYFYDCDNIEPAGNCWESGTPGAAAVRLLRAPGGLGLRAFKRFTIDIDPVTDRDQYLTMAGYNCHTGEYQPFDSVDLLPADKRVLLSSGPFDLTSDSTATFYYAVIAAPYGQAGQPPQNRDTTELALRCWWAEQVFQRVLAVEEPRPPAARCGQLANSPTVFNRTTGLRLNLPLAERGKVVVHDAVGRAVFCSPFDGQTPSVRLDIGTMPPAVYLVRIQTAGLSRTFKVLYLGE